MYLVYMEGAGERIRRENDDQLTYMWVNAALQRADKMPKLEKILSKKANVIDIPPELHNAILRDALEDFSATKQKMTWVEAMERFGSGGE